MHFHEVGAIDSIVDLTGGPQSRSIVETGYHPGVLRSGGRRICKLCARKTACARSGNCGVAAEGIPVKTGLVPFETTTPTGAVILAANVSRFTDQTEFIVQKVGYGLGTRDLEIPNVLRVYLGESLAAALKTSRPVYAGNQYRRYESRAFRLCGRAALEVGALDVFKTPVIMKKRRPAVLLSVLVDKQCQNQILKVIFTETTSIEGAPEDQSG